MQLYEMQTKVHNATLLAPPIGICVRLLLYHERLKLLHPSYNFVFQALLLPSDELSQRLEVGSEIELRLGLVTGNQCSNEGATCVRSMRCCFKMYRTDSPYGRGFMWSCSNESINALAILIWIGTPLPTNPGSGKVCRGCYFQKPCRPDSVYFVTTNSHADA